MTKSTINYQQIYEEELSEATKASLELPGRFYELSHQNRMMVEELVDTGYQRALDDALDPDVLNETMTLSAELGAQLYNFANLLATYNRVEGYTDE